MTSSPKEAMSTSPVVRILVCHVLFSELCIPILSRKYLPFGFGRTSALSPIIACLCPDGNTHGKVSLMTLWASPLPTGYRLSPRL
jgi:hypothetical protein